MFFVEGFVIWFIFGMIIDFWFKISFNTIPTPALPYGQGRNFRFSMQKLCDKVLFFAVFHSSLLGPFDR